MATNTEQQHFHADIMAIYDSCQGILNSNVDLTRSSYHDALELADAAVELAEAARLSEGTQRRCRELQARCLNLLQKEYSESEHRERDHYDKSASAKKHRRLLRPLLRLPLSLMLPPLSLMLLPLSVSKTRGKTSMGNLPG
ncbi:hypothetical protein PG988_007130 [Apiospora saccharicola]